MSEDQKTSIDPTESNKSEIESQESAEAQIPSFVSKAQSVGDDIESLMFTSEDKGDKEETQLDSTEDNDVEQEESTEESDVTEVEEPEAPVKDEKKEIAQRRIDKLIAERNSAQEKIIALEQRLTALESGDTKNVDKKSEEVEFTDDQLKTALNKFMEEENVNGVFDVLQYMNERTEKKLTKRYQDEQKKNHEEVNKRNQEWQSIVEDFSTDSYEDEELKSNPNFNIKNKEGALYRIAEAFYTDKELSNEYRNSGGMKRAVQDAFNELIILNLKNNKPQESMPKVLDVKEKVKAKKNQKQQLGAGADDIGDSLPAKPFVANDELSEALEERRQFKKKRIMASI